MSVAVKSCEFVVRDWQREPLAAQREVEGRAHGLSVKLGKARAATKYADTSKQKVALYGHANRLKKNATFSTGTTGQR